MHIKVLFLPNRNTTCFHKVHEVFIARQHRHDLVRGDLASRFYGTDVKVGVLEGGTSIEKEICKRGPIDSGDILALKSEADGEGEMLDRGKIL